MSMIIFLFLTGISVICFLKHWKRAGILCLSLTVAAFIATGTGIIPQYLTAQLQAGYSQQPPIQWGKNNAIILLGGGTTQIPDTRQVQPGITAYSRILKTATLYQRCAKTGESCHIIISGGDPEKFGIAEADVYKTLLLQLGIASQAIISENKSLNTWQNAQFTKAIIERDRFDNIILVTSGTHIKRSEVYFNAFNITPIAVASNIITARISYLPRWYNFVVTDIALHEYIGLLRYHIYQYLGWNKI